MSGPASTACIVQADSQDRTMVFSVLFAVLVALMGLGITAAFIASGPWAWSLGLMWVGYDALLQMVLVATAWGAVRRGQPIAGGGAGPSLAVLVPARNEVSVLPATIAALMPQLGPLDQLLVVDDGSTDGTAAWCAAHEVNCLSKPNSGKSDSLNQALNSVSEDIIVTIDADTVVLPGSLTAIRTAFAADPLLVAAGGVLTTTYRPAPLARWLAWHQQAEYVRSFLFRAAWDRWRTLLLVSGAFAAYRRAELVAIGGYDRGCLVEDYEITHRLHRALPDRHVGMIPGAQAITDVPGKVSTFLAQRSRWFAGFIQVHFHYRAMVGDRRYGALGLLMLPLKTVDLLLPLAGLMALLILVGLLVVGTAVDPLIFLVIGGKLVLDLLLVVIILRLTARWTGKQQSTWSVVIATMCEPLAYQPLRQIGALLGWIAHLRRRHTWTPQR